MNNFIKEELLNLNIILSLWIIKYPEDLGSAELQSKIESMIDNYCEHDMHQTSSLINYCYKCNHSEFLEL